MRSRSSALALLLLPLAATAGRDREDASLLSARILGELQSARALPDLFRLYELREEVAGLAPLTRTFDRVAADRRARSDLRAAAVLLRAQIAIAQGQLPLARVTVDRIAPVRTWAVIGPFQNEGRGGLRAVYGPEKDGYAAEARYAGRTTRSAGAPCLRSCSRSGTSISRLPFPPTTTSRSMPRPCCAPPRRAQPCCTWARAAPPACGSTAGWCTRTRPSIRPAGINRPSPCSSELETTRSW